jgi:hypothetical protein
MIRNSTTRFRSTETPSLRPHPRAPTKGLLVRLGLVRLWYGLVWRGSVWCGSVWRGHYRSARAGQRRRATGVMGARALSLGRCRVAGCYQPGLLAEMLPTVMVPPGAIPLPLYDRYGLGLLETETPAGRLVGMVGGIPGFLSIVLSTYDEGCLECDSHRTIEV